MRKMTLYLCAAAVPLLSVPTASAALALNAQAPAVPRSGWPSVFAPQGRDAEDLVRAAMIFDSIGETGTDAFRSAVEFEPGADNGTGFELPIMPQQDGSSGLLLDFSSTGGTAVEVYIPAPASMTLAGAGLLPMLRRGARRR